MDTLLLILEKVYPLYFLILIGFLGGKYLKIDKQSIAKLVIYIVIPVIVFNGIYTSPQDKNILLLPIGWFLMSSIVAVITYLVAGFFYKDKTKNILAYMSGTANVGYLGLPLAISVLGGMSENIVIFTILGYLFYENTVGYFIAAKGELDSKVVLKKLLKLPPLYGFILGILANLSGLNLGGNYAAMVGNFKGVFVVLGMMLVGLGLSGIKSLKIDYKFLSLSFLTKFLLWPLLVLAFIQLDIYILKQFTPEIHQVFLLISSVPIAANAVAYATNLENNPDKVAVSVFLSTLFSLIYIPVFIALLVL